MKKNDIDKLFPRDLYGRLALGLSSSVIRAFSAAAFWGILESELFGPRRDLVEHVVVASIGELMFALTMFFGCGLIWAIAMPRWLESAREKVTKKLGVATLAAMFVFTVLLIWAI